MKERIVFFILGALVATVAYFAGDISSLSAREDVKFYDRLTVGTLVARTIMISEGDAGSSHIGLHVKNNVPSINLSNRLNGKEYSGIMLSAFSDFDVTGSTPLILLIGKDDENVYTLTNEGAQKK